MLRLARAFVLRFGIVYWGLFCAVMLATQTYFDIIGEPTVGAARSAIAKWVGEAILGIAEVNAKQNGSGDKLIDWIFILCCAVLALVAATVWTAFDRERAHDERMRRMLRVLLRYTLAFVIISYGLSKMFIGQFPAPNPGRLIQRYGDSSPMGLLWTFMGASPAYVFFSGLAETVGALLLMWRRTTTLGALVLVAVMTNVVLLNFCYDVPVKINSTHYLAMALILLIPVARRIADVVVFERATQPPPPDPVPSRRVRWFRGIVKYVAIVFIVVMNLKDTISDFRARGAGPRTWYDGYWSVAKQSGTGKAWERLKFETDADASAVRWRFTDAAYGDLYKVRLDETARTFTLTWDPDSNDPEQPHPTSPVVLSYTRADDDHLTLAGTIGPDHVTVELARVRTESMLLVTRGFHWISPFPYNR